MKIEKKKTKKKLPKHRISIIRLDLMMLMRCFGSFFFFFFFFFFFDFLYKSTCCGCSFELHRQDYAVQIGIHNTRLYKEVDKYTDCNLKTTELRDCALIGVCAVIKSNTGVCK